MFSLLQQIEGHGLQVIFDFTNCNFLRQNAVAFLGGIARMVNLRGGTVEFALDTLGNDIRANLAQNGFLEAFGYPEQPWTGNSIPYREDPCGSVNTEEEVVKYLGSYWLGRGWLQINPSLRDAIVGKVWEIYANAFEHGRSDIGIFSCGQFYPNLRVLKLAAVDFGVGIPANVRECLSKPEMRDCDALRWALCAGNSTCTGIARGMGLDLLKSFLKANQGRLEIYSHRGYTVIDMDTELHLDRCSRFQGTLVNITLKCDESFFDLAS
ncbi:ATP-binding protein [Gloeobacter violaceus]|uniref:ATP-binding protein n=1 Tax=Gloeobacter violaceus TaxID=33072 RepID=UPI0013E8CD8B|nr:ATP-binding protein [Gloeobacter violaceus]